MFGRTQSLPRKLRRELSINSCLFPPFFVASKNSFFTSNSLYFPMPIFQPASHPSPSSLLPSVSSCPPAPLPSVDGAGFEKGNGGFKATADQTVLQTSGSGGATASPSATAGPSATASLPPPKLFHLLTPPNPVPLFTSPSYIDARRAFASAPSTYLLEPPWELVLVYGDLEGETTVKDSATDGTFWKKKAAPGKKGKRKQPASASSVGRAGKVPKKPSSSPPVHTEFTHPSPQTTSSLPLPPPSPSPYHSFLLRFSSVLRSALCDVEGFQESDVGAKCLELWTGMEEEDRGEHVEA